jgi:1,4-alpha-glucan branching enzyme
MAGRNERSIGTKENCMKSSNNGAKPKVARRAKAEPGPLVVHFEFSDPNAQKVCLAGTFNDWKPEAGRMTRTENGKWAANLKLEPGTYEYRLVVDGDWRPDPNADNAVINPFGERNSLVTVAP